MTDKQLAKAKADWEKIKATSYPAQVNWMTDITAWANQHAERLLEPTPDAMREAIIEECAKLVEAKLVELDSNHPDTIDNVCNAIIGDIAKAIRALKDNARDK